MSSTSVVRWEASRAVILTSKGQQSISNLHEASSIVHRSMHLSEKWARITLLHFMLWHEDGTLESTKHGQPQVVTTVSDQAHFRLLGSNVKNRRRMSKEVDTRSSTQNKRLWSMWKIMVLLLHNHLQVEEMSLWHHHQKLTNHGKVGSPYTVTALQRTTVGPTL